MISEPLDTAEIMLRAGAAALNMLMMVQFARLRPLRFVTAAGALFCLSIASYTLVSDPSPGDPGEALVILAVLTPVFFWWLSNRIPSVKLV